jgi:hypothetical protein
VTISLDAWRWAFVALGVLLRLRHWLADPPIWHDEAALVINVVFLDFRDYFGKLLVHEAAPPLFLVLERLTLLALGDSAMALRLPAVLAGCLALGVFANLARRVLSAGPALLATALFAASERLVWHTQEAKPYAFDVLIAVLVAWGYLRTRERSMPVQCALWGLTLPVAIWLSFPACFVAGGLLLAMLPAAGRAAWGGRLAYVALGLLVVGTFAALALGPAAAQRDETMASDWGRNFPDWSRPMTVPGWVLLGTLGVLRYAIRPLGNLLAPLAVIGAIRIGRSDGRLLTLLLAPLGLGLLAALLGKYPYGGMRVTVFAAPALILCVAAGVVPTWAWLRARHRLAPWLLVPLLALPFGRMAYRTAVPWPREDYRAAVNHVRSAARPEEPVAADAWAVPYYARGRPGGVWPLAEIGTRRPGRVWVVAPSESPARERDLGKVPADWLPVRTHEFPGTVAILYERAGSTSPDGSVP